MFESEYECDYKQAVCQRGAKARFVGSWAKAGLIRRGERTERNGLAGRTVFFALVMGWGSRRWRSGLGHGGWRQKREKNAGEEVYDYRKSEWMKGIREEEDEESESGKAGKSLVAVHDT